MDKQEQELIELLLKCSEPMGQGEIDDETWKEMVKRQNWAVRSLDSDVMIGSTRLAVLKQETLVGLPRG